MLEPTEVVFDVDEARYPLSAASAATLAEGLRLTATGLHRYERRLRNASVIANAIEDVLVGRSADTITLASDSAEAVFYVLHAGSGPSQAEYALYGAVRALHNRLHEDRPSDSSPP
jgi:hypothetical protein